MSADPTSAPPAAVPPPGGKRRWLRRLIGFAVLVAVVVWFAPAVVAHTGLRNRVVAAAAADLNGTVAVGGMSAGWFSAVEFRDVTITDTQGRTVLTVPRVMTERTLLGLMGSRSAPGEIVIHDPVIEVACGGGTTNVEDVLATYLKDDGRPAAATRPAVRVRVLNGTVTLRDAAAGTSGTFSGVEVTADIPADRAAPVAVVASATAAGGSPGTLTATATAGGTGSAEFKADGFPLAALAPLLPRVQPGLVVTGVLTTDLKGRWKTGDATTAALEGTVAVHDLDASGPIFRGDRLTIPTAALPIEVDVGDGTARVRVAGGRLVLADGPAAKPLDIASLTADVSVPVGGKGATAATVAVVTAGDTPGTLEATATVADRGSVRVKAITFPLAALAPALRRLQPGTTVGGTLAADVTATWEGYGHTARVEGSAGVRNLDVTGPWLKGDHVRLAAADLPLKGELRGRAVRIETAELTCDVGRFAVAGAFDPEHPPERLLDQAGVKLDADLDLAKVATLLPNLLRVREGTAVREGKIAATVSSHEGKEGTTWDGTVRTSALKAVRDGKSLEWPEPLAAEFSVRAPAGHPPVFDKLLCKSDFLAVNAQGSAESVRAAANVYLDRLAARLGEFVDLGGVTLSGEASAWLAGTRTPAGAFKADAGAELKNFAFAKPGVRRLAEPQLTVKAHVAGAWPKGGPVRLEAASLEVAAGADRFDARLMEPVADVRAAGGRVTAHLAGDLGRWADRAREVVELPADYQFGGTADAGGTFSISPTAVTGERVTVAISGARFKGAGLDINEPALNVAAGKMTLTRKTGELVFEPVTITSPTLSTRDAKFVFEFPEKGRMAVSGRGPADGDLNRLATTLRIQADPDGPESLHGKAVGPVGFRWQGDTTAFDGSLEVTDFEAGPKAHPTVRDARLKLDLDGTYEQAAGRFTLAKARLERRGLKVDGKGTWANADTTQDVNIAGTLDYDLGELSPELRAALGGNFDARGKGVKPFVLRGSLNPKPGAGGGLEGQAAVGWSSVHAYGFEMGPGELNARVEKGVGTVSPVSAKFAGGQVNLRPLLKLDPAPGELSFAPGKVVEKAKLTPAVCAGAVGYALPVIANAAQAEGEVSFDLDDNRVPLADATKATLRGRLLVHRAAVSPGPVVSEIVQLLGESAPRVVLANEMTVPVRVEGGRVYHENLTLTVNGYAIKTTGSVGFDGSLTLVADVPVPGSFPGLKNNPTLKKALEGKVVKVPVGGTVTQPALDRAGFHGAVAAVGRDAAKNAVQGAGRDLLHRELEQLFPGSTPAATPGGTTAGTRSPLPFGLPIPLPKR